MFGMSMTEILVIMGIVLVVLGPEKIPEAARTVGKFLREIRKASNLLRDAVNLDDVPKPSQPIATVPDQLDPVPVSLPDPRTEMRVVDMPLRNQPIALSEFVLTAPSPSRQPREVYLHVPYEETA